MLIALSFATTFRVLLCVLAALGSADNAERRLRDRTTRHGHGHRAAMGLDFQKLVQKYFSVWNAHDRDGLEALHAKVSTLKDWDATHGPANTDVANGVAGIWKNVPSIKIEVIGVYSMGDADNRCVANIQVIVDGNTALTVCDVFEFDGTGLVVSLNAFKLG